MLCNFGLKLRLVISNRTRAARPFDFEITRMISDQIALHSVQLPLLINRVDKVIWPPLQNIKSADVPSVSEGLTLTLSILLIKPNNCFKKTGLRLKTTVSTKLE